MKYFHRKQIKKKYKVQFSVGLMLIDKKKTQLKKKQLELTCVSLSTCYSGHKIRIT
jgi:hypothetical protein